MGHIVITGHVICLLDLASTQDEGWWKWVAGRVPKDIWYLISLVI